MMKEIPWEHSFQERREIRYCPAMKALLPDGRRKHSRHRTRQTLQPGHGLQGKTRCPRPWKWKEKENPLQENSVLREEIPVQPAAPCFEEKVGETGGHPGSAGTGGGLLYRLQPGKKYLFIIDQHAAHERIRYDRLAAHAGRIPSQQVLVPYLMNIERQDLEILLGHKEELAELGLSFETAGPDVIRMTAVPEDLTEADIDRVIHDLLIAFQEKDIPSPETMRHRMLAYAACRGAIKAGDPLNIRQMKELIADLFHTSRPLYVPMDGRHCTVYTG